MKVFLSSVFNSFPNQAEVAGGCSCFKLERKENKKESKGVKEEKGRRNGRREGRKEIREEERKGGKKRKGGREGKKKGREGGKKGQREIDLFSSRKTDKFFVSNKFIFVSILQYMLCQFCDPFKPHKNLCFK
jgi:hypothetical protein